MIDLTPPSILITIVMTIAGLEFLFLLPKPLYVRLLFALPLFLIALAYGVFQSGNFPIEQRSLISRYALLIHGCALCVIGVWYKGQSDLIGALRAERDKLALSITDYEERNQTLIVRLGKALHDMDVLQRKSDGK